MAHTLSDSPRPPIQPHRWFLFGFTVLCLMTVWIAVPHLTSGTTTYTATNSTGSPGESTSPPLTREDVESSLVLIKITWTTSYQSYGKGGPISLEGKVESLCTGFFVDDDTTDSASVATAAHCVDESSMIKQMLLLDLQQQAKNPTALLGLTASGLDVQRSVRISQSSQVKGATLDSDGLLAQVVGSRPDDDVALLRLNMFPDAVRTLQFAETAPTTGDSVVVAGFANSVVVNSDEARPPVSFKDGTVSSRTIGLNGAAFTELSASMTQGMSGGPAFDSTFRVIGVISHGVDEQAFNFVTDTVGTQIALSALANG